MMLKIFILIAANLPISQVTAYTFIQPASATDIFLSQGSIIYNHDHTTLKINVYVTSPYTQPLKVSQNISDLSIYQAASSKLKSSKPNDKPMSNLMKRIRNHDQEDMKTMKLL